MRTIQLPILISLLSFSIFSQNTLIPDINFEYQLISQGYDTAPADGMVTTANINSITYFNVVGAGISDLTGIEDFTALQMLSVTTNNLTSLDVSQNSYLTNLGCGDNSINTLILNSSLQSLSAISNNLTSIDLTQCYNLTYLSIGDNNFNVLDLSNNPYLEQLHCGYNVLNRIDLSNNNSLTKLDCSHNNLICLNVKNGNNLNVTEFKSTYNPNLQCIEVDSVLHSVANWSNIDANSSFNVNCNNTCSSVSTDIYEKEIEKYAIYPNPSITGQFNISQSYNSIVIYSCQGEQVNFTNTNGVIDISNNEIGVYFIYVDGAVSKFIYQ